MSTLAKIIYEETGLKRSGTPGEYEEVESACMRYARSHNGESDDTALLKQALEALEQMHACTYKGPALGDAAIVALRERLGGKA
jgi:hypothetical protein